MLLLLLCGPAGLVSGAWFTWDRRVHEVVPSKCVVERILEGLLLLRGAEEIIIHEDGHAVVVEHRCRLRLLLLRHALLRRWLHRWKELLRLPRMRWLLLLLRLMLLSLMELSCKELLLLLLGRLEMIHQLLMCLYHALIRRRLLLQTSHAHLLGLTTRRKGYSVSAIETLSLL